MATTAEPTELIVTDPDRVEIVAFRWSPAVTPRAVVHVMHGLAEHALRYARLAARLNAAGYVVYADDHRGHGQTGLRSDSLGDLGPRGMAGVVDAVPSRSASPRTTRGFPCSRSGTVGVRSSSTPT